MGNSLKGTKSHENLKHAFAGESQANRRYLYFARRADIEGYPDVGGLFRDTSEAETGHAFGHLDFLKEVGDPATGVPIGNTEANLKSSVPCSSRRCKARWSRACWPSGFSPINYRCACNCNCTSCFGVIFRANKPAEYLP